jgi:hypothetical protein
VRLNFVFFTDSVSELYGQRMYISLVVSVEDCGPEEIYYYFFLLLLLLLTTIELSLGGSSPYTSTDKTNKNKYT